MHCIVCDKAFVPYLLKENLIKQDGDNIKTNTPEACQKLVHKLMPGYKLLFGENTNEIIRKNKYFTV